MLSKLQIESAMHHMATGTMGGFARKLADAWFVADLGNQDTIEKAFQPLIERSYHSWATQPATLRD